ncbi:penicillin acylase family protein [Halorubrum sp. 2020YC2]|uniref:penicillin acylase family protein n=1 Tax=Halorubrum sp. 2020YC2 TaxID=2836432 RepID=UPI001BE59079|nr:penicillin acylase family protein [Halorubrum sp. 2020YC2]QWC18167.1 penicillin acylase family protein [Halorubrum sp. 2020YC2]
MTRDTTRRAVLASVLAAGTAGLAASDAADLLDSFAPLSGGAWDAADRSLPETVESPHGAATVARDEFGVPQVEADAEPAAYFAVGYCQAVDRLFAMDLQRRVMRGRLSEVIGEATLDGDEFNVAMGFADAAEATWEVVAETRAGPLVEAFADGVNAAIDDLPLPLEFELIGYEPAPWTPVDSMLMEKQISWTLTGDFGELRRALVADRLGAERAETLFPRRYDHEYPILDGTETRLGEGRESARRRKADAGEEADPVAPALTDWLSGFESPTGVGSNSWVVSGDHTASGTPILAYDPHLSLQAPPLWYEQSVDTPERSVRGATFSGVPFVIAGANGRGAWSFTNLGADVLDCYRYEIDDAGDRYRYDGEWRPFETDERETIPVAGGEDREIRVRRTVHGPLIEREGRTVGVAWTGHAATRTTAAIEAYGRSEGVDDLLAATRDFDLPTQNLVYADADGRTLYFATGRLPVRRIDGEVVDGDRIFDGSAGEGEWEGFEPFGESSWAGFVPFEEKPHALDPDALSTANQRPIDDPTHYVGVGYATPYRGARIAGRLDDRISGGAATDPDFHRDLQSDVRDGRAPELVPELVAAVRDRSDPGQPLVDAADALDSWEYRTDRGSRAALLFARYLPRLRERVFGPAFSDADLDESYYPSDWTLARLPGDDPLFDGRSRGSLAVAALRDALDEIDEAGWEAYGDYNTTRAMDHPLGSEAPFLNYDERPADGSPATVKNYRVESAVGSSWRMVVRPGTDATAVLPGGNSGDYFSEHYDDQLRRWLDNDQRPMPLGAGGDPVTRFEPSAEGSR